METILKQRLIGAAVIIALAVVLVPMVLDGAGIHVIPDIPDQPAYVTKRTAKIIKVVHDKVPDLPNSAKRLSRPDEQRAISSSPKSTKPDKRWSIQIASFNVSDNAKLLKKKLVDAGFKAYIAKKRYKKTGKIAYRVRIGPENNQFEARKLLARLKHEVMLNGFITTKNEVN